MATSHDSNFKLIESNYLQAAENYYSDMAATRTPIEVQKVEQNYQQSESAWAMALNAVLSRSDPQVERAAKDLKAANAETKAARASREALAGLVSKLQMAASLAGTLVRIAAI